MQKFRNKLPLNNNKLLCLLLNNNKLCIALAKSSYNFQLIKTRSQLLQTVLPTWAIEIYLAKWLLYAVTPFYGIITFLMLDSSCYIRGSLLQVSISLIMFTLSDSEIVLFRISLYFPWDVFKGSYETTLPHCARTVSPTPIFSLAFFQIQTHPNSSPSITLGLQSVLWLTLDIISGYEFQFDLPQWFYLEFEYDPKLVNTKIVLK